MKFRDLCVNQQLDADTAGRGDSLRGLCMHQYQFMFNSCRIPKLPADVVNTYDPEKNQHVSVMRKGKFYVFSLVDEKFAVSR